MTLADGIVLLRSGLIEQVGTPREIFERPDSQFVAAFIGTPAMNFFEVDVNGSELNAAGRNAPAVFVDRERFDLNGSKTVVAGVRPATSAPRVLPTLLTSSMAMSTSSNSLAMTLWSISSTRSRDWRPPAGATVSLGRRSRADDILGR